MTGEGKFQLFSLMEIVQFLKGETRTSTVKQQKQGREVFKLEPSGETNFLGGHPPTFAGHCFSLVVTGGCAKGKIFTLKFSWIR